MDADYQLRHTYPLVIVISGPSGSGKDSVVQAMKKRGQQFHFVVTATNREKRSDEVDGQDYLFVPTEEFARMIEQDELIEYAIVYGDYKGIPRGQVRAAMASGKDVVMRLDVQGAETIRRKAPEALLIFITTDNEQDLIRRLESRKSETADELAIRIARARTELTRVQDFDYVVVNHENELDKTVEQVCMIIEAEHLKVHHRRVSF